MVICLALAACGDDGGTDPDRPQPTTTNPTTTQSPTETDEQSLRQLAQDWYEASQQAYLDDGYDLQQVSQFLTDPYLSEFVGRVEAYRAEGNQSRSGEASRQVIEQVTVDGDEATVAECIVDGEVLLNSEGGVLNDSVVTSRVRTSARRTADGWRFVERELLGDDQEGDACGE